MSKKEKIEITPHRSDLADIIINKSLNIKQDERNDVIYFFVAKPFTRFAAFLILLISFYAGFDSSSNKSYQTTFSDQSVIEDIYYSNSI